MWRQILFRTESVKNKIMQNYHNHQCPLIDIHFAMHSGMLFLQDSLRAITNLVDVSC